MKTNLKKKKTSKQIILWLQLQLQRSPAKDLYDLFIANAILLLLDVVYLFNLLLPTFRQSSFCILSFPIPWSASIYLSCLAVSVVRLCVVSCDCECLCLFMCGVCVEYPKNIHYTFKIDFLTLRQQILLCLCVLDKDFHLGGNVLLEVHGPGHPVLRQHGGTVVLDVVQLVGGGLLPGVDGAQRTVKVGQLLAEGCNLVDLDLEAVANLKLLADSLDLLLDNLFLVLGKGDAHALEVAVDGVEKVGDGGAAGLVDVLALLEILQSGLKVEALLHLLYLLLGFLKLGGNGLVVLGIADPGVLCLS